MEVARLHAIGLICITSLLLFALPDEAVRADEPTSESDARLASWLRNFPTADENQDGILTRDEAAVYREKVAAQRRAKRPGRAPLRPTREDVPYGAHERHVLDLYQAESPSPTPVLIYFHGGGFVGGDKSRTANVALCQQCLASGISVVGANYRFVRLGRGERRDVSFPAPMMDGARVIQFVRSQAGEWNIDPERIALCGGSAGACMSIWLAVHDDLADPRSEDPVLRLSTRVSCVVAYGGQTALDPAIILKSIGGDPEIHPSLRPFFGVRTLADLQAPEKQMLVHRATAIHHVSLDDPPLYLRYGGRLAGTPLPEDTSIGASIHHPMFGKLIKDEYDPLGIPCHLACSDVRPDVGELSFLRKHLGRQ
jgi:hypothetical protein